MKKRYCAVIDPNNRELVFRVPLGSWLPLYVSSEFVQREFQEFGNVKEVTREQCNSPGFEDAESTTRIGRIVLKEGLSIEDSPHMFKLYGGLANVVVPGRPPIRLRCKKIDHIRRDCRTPRCSLFRACDTAGKDASARMLMWPRVLHHRTTMGASCLWTRRNWRTP